MAVVLPSTFKCGFGTCCWLNTAVIRHFLAECRLDFPDEIRWHLNRSSFEISGALSGKPSFKKKTNITNIPWKWTSFGILEISYLKKIGSFLQGGFPISFRLRGTAGNLVSEILLLAWKVPLEHVCDGYQEQWDNCPGPKTGQVWMGGRKKQALARTMNMSFNIHEEHFNLKSPFVKLYSWF